MSYQRPSFWHYRESSNKKKVAFGSPADGQLHRGDIITKVGNYDSRDIRHQDAQNLFKNAGTNARVVVQREIAPRQNSTGSSRGSSYNYSPLSLSPNLSPKSGQYSNDYSPSGYGSASYQTSSPLPPLEPYWNNGKNDDQDDTHVTKQPYRTTPLVLPGAKVKREPGPTESYLRHHPNPAVRAPPHHLDNGQYIVKQKAANSVLDRISTGDPNKQIIHKQFNSPINLYSEPNIADTIHKQTGIVPVRKQVKFNPTESETYKAIQEEEHIGEPAKEVLEPPQTRVYTPNKTIPPKKPAAIVNQSAPYGHALGESEVIQQSGSFKRLMLSVLPESSY